MNLAFASDEILVSISCITYNHEPYIKDAIEGFLMQRTNFRYEILIHDDASTDNTSTIIKEYENKYPDIIKPIYETENQWSRGIKGSAIFNFPRAKGKYIALCEGDDYWTDPLKLQKQVDFLETHAEYGLVHTNYRVINSENQYLFKCDHKWQSGNVFELIYKNKYHIVTPSVLFRTNLYKELKTNSYGLNIGDLPMWLTFSHLIKFKYMNEKMVNYRVLKNSASHSENLRKIYVFYYYALSIRREYASMNNIEFDKKYFYSRLYETMIKECFFKNDFNSALCFYKKMISCSLFNLIKLKPLIFLIGGRHNSLLKKIYRINE